MTDLFSYHIDPNDGLPRRCSRPDTCRWVNPEAGDRHYSSFDEGRYAFEEMMRPYAWVRFHKRSAGHRHVKEEVKPVR